VRLPFKFLFLLVLLVAGTTNAWSADGRILSFEGDVRVNGKSVTANTVLNSEDTIVTAAGASVKIVLSDNSVLDIDSGSKIKLSDYSYNPAAPKESKSDIGVVEGTLRYVSGAIAKDDPKNISFTAGNSTIGVRGSFTGIEVDGATVNVEAMIGEATLIRKDNAGQQDAVVVPTGKATQIDPTTGKTVVAPSTSSNKVNEVVHAIAAAAPDASNRLATDEGCSEGLKPLRDVAHPATDAETAAAIEAQLAALSEGELMMVMAVLINNAGHLCIDSNTVAATITKIATVQPEVVANVAVVAVLLDPKSAEKFNESATPVPPGGPDSKPPVQPAEPPINNEIPPGGNIGEPPSPE
jgi:hypothetical protein